MRHEIDVREAMRHFSEDTLNRLYSETLAKIRNLGAHARSTAFLAFSLLLCSHETFSTASFLAALDFVDQKRETIHHLPQVLTICSNLINVDSRTDTLRFAHTSVQEFLEAQAEFVPQRINSVVATCCLHSCVFGLPVGLGAGLSPTNNFYHYGVLYWAEHCKATFALEQDTELLYLVKDFMFDDNEISLSFIGWLEDASNYALALPRHHPLKKKLSAIKSQDSSALYTLCVFGLASLVEEMALTVAFDWNAQSESGHSGLYLACLSGQQNAVRILLDRGADANASGGRLGTPLHAACFEGFTDIVLLLIENGADQQLSGVFGNAMEAALAGGHEDIAMLLLQNGFKLDTQNEYDRLLQKASQIGHTKVVDHLQRHNYSVFSNSGSAKYKAIQAAISKGQIGVLQRFVQKLQNPKTELPADSPRHCCFGWS